MENSDSNIEEMFDYPSTDAKRSSKKLWIVIGILVLVVVLMIVTCPDKEDHKDAVTSELKEVVRSQTDFDADMMGLVGNMFTNGIVDIVVDNTLDVDNYGVCSVGRMSLGANTKTVSFGLLGHVFTFDAKDVEQQIEKQ